MIGEITNHLWQSTLIGVTAGLLTLAFRKERAEVRYWLWFAASCKFLVPFALLISLGRRMGWVSVAREVVVPTVSFRMEQLTQPFSPGSTTPFHATGSMTGWTSLVIFVFWGCGFGLIALVRLQGWCRIRAAVRSSVVVDIPSPVEIRSSPGLLEPGIVGLIRPILLLPAGVAERLTAGQLRAVLAHELCHVRRRDNLTAAIHMIVEALFWFHPLTWWMGARLVEERERACDEAVLGLGNEPQEYAEGILQVCKSYLESPLACVAGVTGSDLKRRIEAIVAGSVGANLTPAKKILLTTVGITALALPILAGSISAARKQALAATTDVTGAFETASVRSCAAFRKSAPGSWSPGRLRSECTTVQQLIEQAYGLFANGRVNPGSTLTVSGGPTWAASDFYEIDAKAQTAQTRAMMNGPMMQRLLEDRFKLKVHRETKEVPVYVLTVAQEGEKLEKFEGTCATREFDDEPSDADCATARGSGNGFKLRAATIGDLCAGLLVFLDRPVVDETGIAGRYNLQLDFPPEDYQALNRARSLPALRDPTNPEPAPISFDGARSALKNLGLNLEPAKGPGNYIVIDQVERPSGT